ncbi:MAG: electron transfer flavoprotein subunit alpha/FixB family protein [Chloroflexi bacterium]|nr:electron transfer flavoprotein subunit alpha/FixB family protein [Chloroflexota bacterium]
MIFVWTEHFDDKLAQASREALGKATKLGAGEVVALVFGENVDDIVKQSFHYGADKVIKADDATLANFRAEPYVALLVKAAQEHNPNYILAASTARGREVMGGASMDLDAGLISDVNELEIEGGNLKAVRPVYSGKVLATETASGDLQMATLRSRAFTPNEPDESRSGEVIELAPVLSEADITSKVESFEEAKGSVSLTDAAIIVSGGRGVGGPDGFDPVRELAEVLGAALGASRATVDAGWIPYEHQVGQTGKVVSPDLYIAAGISGAIQHQAGMRTAKVIVAINKDPEAPIFGLATYGIVGDLFQYVPALTKAFKERLGK